MISKERIHELLEKVREHQKKYQQVASHTRNDAQLLIDSARKVEASASGSNFGYHAELYYRDFQKPPLGAEFNVEWGGVMGPQQGWEQKTADDVKSRIENLSGSLLKAVEQNADELIREAKDVRDELLIVLAPLHDAAGLTKEKELLDEFEGFDWAEDTRDRFCTAAMEHYPNASRDSNAVMQGSRLPAHDYFEGIACQAVKSCDSVESFWKKSERLLRQLAVHVESQSQVTHAVDAAPVVRLICNRFHAVALQLAKRRNNRSTLTIADEYDVQDLLHSLLRLHFQDVRPEEYTPSFGGGTARMDFLLKEEKLVIEAKMTRSNLKDKEVAEELIQDVATYKNHPDCTRLVCLVYDPQGFLKNPPGLISDIERLSSESLIVEVCSVPQR